MDIKDAFQIGAWVVAIAGGLVAASKALTEIRRSTEQRREDMRWKQAEMAKKCLDEVFNNSLARSAMKMLDWSGLIYDMPGGGKTGQIDHEARRLALRTTNTVFTPGDAGPFIRDAFDALFDGFERLEHFVRIKLIMFDDVEQPLSYYVAKLADPEDRAVVRSFLQAYGFQLGQDFLDRFPPWRAAAKDGTGKILNGT
jgi:hypothetical protein